MSAIKAACHSNGIQPDRPIEVGQVAHQLRKLDPNLFSRLHVEKWKDFLPFCQRYVAVFLVIPPVQGDIWESKGDHLYMIYAVSPYYSRPAAPPSYVAQMDMLCQQLGINLHTWLNRKALRSQAEAQSKKKDVRTEWPPLPVQLPPDLESRLSRPDFYWTLIDVMRNPPSIDGEIHLNTLYNTLRFRVGPDALHELLTPCRGLKRWLGLAARYVKLGMARSDPEIIILLDRDYPFHNPQDNEEYRAYVAETDAGSSRQVSEQY